MKLAEVYVERLNKLADFLDTLPPERFDMNRWAQNGFSPEECGTVACAFGWSVHLFENQLRLVGDGLGGLSVNYAEIYGIEAASAFFFGDFGDDDDDYPIAQFVFMPDHYRSCGSGLFPDKVMPGYVARRIRWILATPNNDLANMDAYSLADVFYEQEAA